MDMGLLFCLFSLKIKELFPFSQKFWWLFGKFLVGNGPALSTMSEKRTTLGGINYTQTFSKIS